MTTALRFVAVDVGLSGRCRLTASGTGGAGVREATFSAASSARACVQARSSRPASERTPRASVAMNGQRRRHCAVTRLGVALCSGSGWRSQRRDGTRVDRSAPVRVAESEEP